MSDDSIFELGDQFSVKSPFGNWQTPKITAAYQKIEFYTESAVDYMRIHFTVNSTVADANALITLHTSGPGDKDLALQKKAGSTPLKIGDNTFSINIKRDAFYQRVKAANWLLKFYFTVTSGGADYKGAEFDPKIFELSLGEIQVSDAKYVVNFSIRSANVKEATIKLAQTVNSVVTPIPSLEKVIALPGEVTTGTISAKQATIDDRITKSGDNFVLQVIAGTFKPSKEVHFKDEATNPEETPGNTTCGIEYRNEIECTRYKKVNYGPLYRGNLPVSGFERWKKLIDEKKTTAVHQKIIVYMAENEGGKLDAVQAYDSETATVGAMQKTIDPNGFGEFPIQLYEFGQLYPKLLQSLVTDCGWTIKREKNTFAKDEPMGYRAYYNGKTGTSFKKELRTDFSSANYGKKKPCIPLEPFINLCKNVDFQEKQIIDYEARITLAMSKDLKDYDYPLSAYVISELGIATVLDHSVNRPSHVSFYFNEALNRFFKTNAISKNPADWGDKHASYEKKILDIYGPLRGEPLIPKSDPMTSAADRYNNLKLKFP